MDYIVFKQINYSSIDCINTQLKAQKVPEKKTKMTNDGRSFNIINIALTLDKNSFCEANFDSTEKQEIHERYTEIINRILGTAFTFYVRPCRRC